jgi:hypothetical protein
MKVKSKISIDYRVHGQNLSRLSARSRVMVKVQCHELDFFEGPKVLIVLELLLMLLYLAVVKARALHCTQIHLCDIVLFAINTNKYHK